MVSSSSSSSSPSSTLHPQAEEPIRPIWMMKSAITAPQLLFGGAAGKDGNHRPHNVGVRFDPQTTMEKKNDQRGYGNGIDPMLFLERIEWRPTKRQEESWEMRDKHSKCRKKNRLPAEQRAVLWYTKKELREMRAQAKQLVRQQEDEKRQSSDGNEPPMVDSGLLRGLEDVCASERWSKKSRRSACIQRVLDEQDRQRLHRSSASSALDVEVLRRVSEEESRYSVLLALHVARLDYISRIECEDDDIGEIQQQQKHRTSDSTRKTTATTILPMALVCSAGPDALACVEPDTMPSSDESLEGRSISTLQREDLEERPFDEEGEIDYNIDRFGRELQSAPLSPRREFAHQKMATREPSMFRSSSNQTLRSNHHIHTLPRVPLYATALAAASLTLSPASAQRPTLSNSPSSFRFSSPSRMKRHNSLPRTSGGWPINLSVPSSSLSVTPPAGRRYQPILTTTAATAAASPLGGVVSQHCRGGTVGC